MADRVYMPKSDWLDVCDAVREKLGTADTYTSDEVGDKIREIDTVSFNPTLDRDYNAVDTSVVSYPEALDTEWVRPAAYPNLDAITVNANEIYLTFRKTNDDDFLSFTVTCSGNYTVQIGSISGSSFVPTSTETESSGTQYTYAGAATGYLVCKISASNITGFVFNKVLGLDGSHYWNPQENSCVERYCNLPNITALVDDNTNLTSWATYNIEHDKVIGVGTSCTSLAGAWENAFALRKVDFVNCNFVNVTDLSYAFNNCYAIGSIDLSGVNLVNVQCNMDYIFNNCTALTEVIVADSTKVKPTSIQYGFNDVGSIEELDLSWIDFSITTSCTYLFNGMSNLKSITFDGTPATRITSMAYMFNRCYALQEVDLSWIQSNAITSVAAMLSGCYSLTGTIDLSHIGTANCTSFSSMFSSCAKVEHIYLNNFNPVAATSLGSMFANCYKLIDIDFGDDDVHHAAPLCTNIRSMFSSCTSLKRIVLNGLSVPTADNLYGVWYNCQSLEYLEMNGLNIQAATSAYQHSSSYSPCFYQCFALKEVYLDGLNPNNMASLRYKTSSSATTYDLFHDSPRIRKISMKNMVSSTLTSTSWLGLADMPYLEELDLSGSKLSNATLSLASAFAYGRNLKVLNLDGFQCVPTSCSSMFYACEQLTECPDMSGISFSACTSIGSMFAYCYAIEEIDLHSMNCPLITSASSVFSGCYKLRSVDLSSFDVGSVCTSLGSMFSDCCQLTTINLPSLEHTSTVTTWSSMFNGCRNLTTVNMPLVDTSGATTFASMFANCLNLKSLNLNHFDVSSATTMASMFSYCTSLEEVYIDQWTTSAALTTISSMFQYCASLKSITLGNFLTNDITTTTYLFYYCSSLREADLSKLATQAVTTMAYMFMGCQALETIDMSAATTANVASGGVANIFVECQSLKEINMPLAVWSKMSTSNPTIVSDNAATAVLCIGSPKYNTNLSRFVNIGRDELLDLLDSIERTATARTLTIGNNNLAKLTAAEIAAFKTDKNFTLA